MTRLSLVRGATTDGDDDDIRRQIIAISAKGPALIEAVMHLPRSIPPLYSYYQFVRAEGCSSFAPGDRLLLYVTTRRWCIWPQHIIPQWPEPGTCFWVKPLAEAMESDDLVRISDPPPWPRKRKGKA